jgi:ABC-2 type transport system ATP-binding protein
MRQRLGIAIALSKDPPALIMDEPTTGLDPRGAHDLTRLIGQLRDEGRALLVVTHDVHRVKEMADEVVIFRAGRTLEPRRASDVADVEALYREITEGELAAPAGA